MIVKENNNIFFFSSAAKLEPGLTCYSIRHCGHIYVAKSIEFFRFLWEKRQKGYSICCAKCTNQRVSWFISCNNQNTKTQQYMDLFLVGFMVSCNVSSYSICVLTSKRFNWNKEFYSGDTHVQKLDPARQIIVYFRVSARKPEHDTIWNRVYDPLTRTRLKND